MPHRERSTINEPMAQAPNYRNYQKVRAGRAFVLPDYLRELYKSFGNSLDRFHDESEYRLPMPARYVIDRQGIIDAADMNADYTIRPEPSETVRILRTLTAREAL